MEAMIAGEKGNGEGLPDVDDDSYALGCPY
jgi:hypothetical protein